jgi:hypothetical protein
MNDPSKFNFGGLDRSPANLLRLISDLEGSSQLLKYMGFQDDMEILDTMKKTYYRMYFKSIKGK